MLIQINKIKVATAQESQSEFPFTDGSVRKNFIIFGADLSSSVDIDNKNKDILILGEGPTTSIR